MCHNNSQVYAYTSLVNLCFPKLNIIVLNLLKYSIIYRITVVYDTLITNSYVKFKVTFTFSSIYKNLYIYITFIPHNFRAQ